MHASYHRFSPGSIKPGSESSFYKNLEMDKMYALNLALYAGNEQRISPKLSLLYGLRFSLFQNIGETTIYDYEKNERGFPDNINVHKIDSMTLIIYLLVMAACLVPLLRIPVQISLIIMALV